MKKPHLDSVIRVLRNAAAHATAVVADYAADHATVDGRRVRANLGVVPAEVLQKDSEGRARRTVPEWR